MGRSSNDDRGDSMNPNNDAYWASLDNHHSQLGDSDDCEGLTFLSPRVTYRISEEPPFREPQWGSPEKPFPALTIKPDPVEERYGENLKKLAELAAETARKL